MSHKTSEGSWALSASRELLSETICRRNSRGLFTFRSNFTFDRNIWALEGYYSGHTEEIPRGLIPYSQFDNLRDLLEKLLYTFSEGILRAYY